MEGKVRCHNGPVDNVPSLTSGERPCSSHSGKATGDLRVAGKLRADLETVGKPIGAYDILVAGQALRLGLTLITANIREFSRVRGLKWQDWAKP